MVPDVNLKFCIGNACDAWMPVKRMLYDCTVVDADLQLPAPIRILVSWATFVTAFCL